MKILLASNGKFLIEKGYKLLGIPKDKIRIGWIITASKGVEKLDYLERHKKAMNDEGYHFEEFDIEGKSEKEILEFFEDKKLQAHLKIVFLALMVCQLEPTSFPFYCQS